MTRTGGTSSTATRGGCSDSLRSTAAMWPLAPLGDEEAVIAGIGRYQGETIWVKTSGGEERLMFTGYKSKRKAT